MINLDKVSENVDYELIPVEGSPNEQAWDIRILTGIFTETVIRYGNIGFDNDRMTFNFSIVTSTDDELTVNDVDLQDNAGMILEDIIAKSIADGTLITKDRDGN